VRNYAEEIIVSIRKEYARGGKDIAELEAKSLFKLLNYCPPRHKEPEKTSDSK
jgi:hypothetical protein